MPARYASRPARSLLSGAVCLGLALFAAGCAQPVNAPGAAPTEVAPDAGGSPTAVTPKAPASTPTPDATATAAESAMAAQEALVSLEERVQALDLRISKLGAAKEPAVHQSELDAAVDDLQKMSEQLHIVGNGFAVWDAPTRQEREARAQTVMATLLAALARLKEVPGVAGSPAADQLARVQADVAAAQQAMAAYAGTPGAAPAGTATP